MCCPVFGILFFRTQRIVSQRQRQGLWVRHNLAVFPFLSSSTPSKSRSGDWETWIESFLSFIQ